MSEFSGRLHDDIARLRDRILTDPIGVLDPEGVTHHEFVSGKHGRKLDFDKIVEGTDFYIQWVALYARAIRSIYADQLPDAVVGIANGANRLSTHIAALLGGQVLGLVTTKTSPSSVELDDASAESLRVRRANFIVTIDDVGTTGGTTATAVNHLRDLGVEHIEAVSTWQRSPTLPRLDELDIAYHAVIFEPLPTFSAEECETNPDGYCAQGVPLIAHD